MERFSIGAEMHITLAVGIFNALENRPLVG